MPSVEKVSIALPPEMVSMVRAAVDAGEYSSSSEVVREALRDWSRQRALREKGLEELRRVWQQAVQDHLPGVSPHGVFKRLERKYQARKYQAIADAAEKR